MAAIFRPDFVNTKPVVTHHAGPQEITVEEADELIRASWPLTAHRFNGCDYSAHTSECSQECEDNDHQLPGAPIAALLAIFFLLVGVGIGAALLWFLRPLLA
jgi:hypothetical protein